jgi:hypothetical protein
MSEADRRGPGATTPRPVSSATALENLYNEVAIFGQPNKTEG